MALSDVAARVTKIAQEVIKYESCDAAIVTQELVPRDRGVYLWRNKISGAV